MNVVGFTISGYDNGTFMFDAAEDGLHRCPGCGFRTDFFASNPKYVQKRKRRSDLLFTYDGQQIVTQKFKDFCLSNNYQGLRFLEFEKDKDHFHLIVDNVVPFDAVRYGTRFGPICPVCGNYAWAAGATPAYLSIDRPMEDGLYRTDVLFADGDSKSPLLVVAPITLDKIKAAQLKGLIIEPARGRE